MIVALRDRQRQQLGRDDTDAPDVRIGPVLRVQDRCDAVADRRELPGSAGTVTSNTLWAYPVTGP